MRIVAKHLTGARAGESDTFTSTPVTVGRVPTSSLRLGLYDTRASARHAELLTEKDRIIISDLGSTNGTFVNGQRVQSVILHNGDVVEFGVGGPQLLFELEGVSNNGAMDRKAGFDQQVNQSAQKSDRRRMATKINNPVNKTADRDFVATIQAERPDLTETPDTLLRGEREFPIKSQFKYYLSLPGTALFASGVSLIFLSRPLAAIPLSLLGLTMLILGLALGRKNITVTRRGIRSEGLLTSQVILWDEINQLHAQRSRTQLLTHQVYTIEGRRGRIVFSPSGYLNGFELAQIIARQSGRQWGRD